MGACANSSFFSNMELNLGGDTKEGFAELDAFIQSYTPGLKTQLRDLMAERDIFGQVVKNILPPGKDVNDKNNPIQTLIHCKGAEGDIKDFAETIKEVVDENVVNTTKITEIQELGPPETLKTIIEPTVEKIKNRRGSDAGDDPKEESKEINVVAKTKAKMREKAKVLINTISNIPFLAEYADQVKEKWSLRIEEQPKEVFTITSLFPPAGTYSFPLYKTDGPWVLKACLEWKTGIPFEAVELYTTKGIPLTDPDTLQKEKKCIYVDTRVTQEFFKNHEEAQFKKKLDEIIDEPFVLHKMALHKMTVESLKTDLLKKDDEMAIGLLKEDLCISGVIALKILKIIRANK